MAEIVESKVVYYDIEWNKIRTVKDLKSILKILASKVVIDHSNEEDREVYENLKNFLVESTDQEIG